MLFANTTARHREERGSQDSHDAQDENISYEICLFAPLFNPRDLAIFFIGTTPRPEFLVVPCIGTRRNGACWHVDGMVENVAKGKQNVDVS